MKVRQLILAAGLAALLAPAGAAAAPQLKTPDFGNPTDVKSSLKAMQRYTVKQERETGSWQARRAVGVCGDALRRLNGRVTSQAYGPEVGEKIWRDCHDAYSRVH